MTTDVREVTLSAVAPFLDEPLLNDLKKILPGMDFQAIRNLLGEVDTTHQRINTLRLDVITLITAEVERQGLDDDPNETSENTNDSE